MSMPLNLSPRTNIDLNDSCNCCIPKKDKHSQENEIDERVNNLSVPILPKAEESPRNKDKSIKKIKANDLSKKTSTHKLELFLERKST